MNHQVRHAARPSGVPTDSDWELTAEPVQVPGPGEFVVSGLYLSIDPGMRRWINADVADALKQHAPEGKLFAGENTGKLVLALQ